MRGLYFFCQLKTSTQRPRISAAVTVVLCSWFLFFWSHQPLSFCKKKITNLLFAKTDCCNFFLLNSLACIFFIFFYCFNNKMRWNEKVRWHDLCQHRCRIPLPQKWKCFIVQLNHRCSANEKNKTNHFCILPTSHKILYSLGWHGNKTGRTKRKAELLEESISPFKVFLVLFLLELTTTAACSWTWIAGYE